MRSTNWKAMQAYKGEPPASDILPRYMVGGYWRADLSQRGEKRMKSSGATSVRKR